MSAVTGLMLVIGAVTPATVAAAGAKEAASPGWRIVKYFGACASIGARSVSTTGANDAWATGQAFRFQCDRPGLLIAHWDGRSWRELSPPAGFAGLRHDTFGTSIAALSPSYSWTFVNRENPNPTGLLESFALLRSGGRWRAFRLADSLTAVGSVAFSRSDAWVFGNTNFESYGAHFNGRFWRRMYVPVNPYDVAFAGPRSIWVVGTHRQPLPPRPLVLMHWTGRWQKPIHFPAGTFGLWVVPDGAHGAWLAGGYHSGPNIGGALLHWTGSRWVVVKVPFPTQRLGPLARDGHGGLWVASATCFQCGVTAMYHYSAGSWSKAPLSVPGLNLTATRLIPGTRSVWASGWGVADPDGQGDTVGVMLKFGR